jgi:hypothetical protein
MVKGGFEVYNMGGWRAGTWTGTGTETGEQGTGIVEAKTWY